MTETATPRRAGVYGRQSLGNRKSIGDQLAECRADVEQLGWTLVGQYDDSVSASGFASRGRTGWPRLVEDLEAGQLDAVVIWEASRGDRKLTTWSEFLDLCIATNTLIRVTDTERTLDPTDPGDWEWLAREGVSARTESVKISRRTLRGHRQAASAGRPAMGQPPYGYRRTYGLDPDRHKPVMTGQEPDPDRAEVVRRIFDQLAASVPVSTVAKQLNDDQVPPPGKPNDTRTGRTWTRPRVREIATNPAYIGLRVHRRQGRNANGAPQTFHGGWEPLVSADTFHAVGRILGHPSRTTTRRPGRQAHLLTFLATCYRGHPLTSRADRYYVCQRGCVLVVKAALDELVEATAVEALADPKVYRRLRKAGELSDREAQAATDQVATLVAELADWRASTHDGRGTTPETMAAVEAGLAPQIEAARRRADAAGLDPALRPFVEPGADVEARWEAATVQAKRAVIRALMTIRVLPTGQRPRVPVAERVDITPLRGAR